ncbi:hypothetical protein KJ671_00555 [Patescibacteria group bacterium]|nr:hypothetical protein [Patescibacteria group bacterium]
MNNLKELRFGDLEDIILIKKVEVQSLQKELNSLFNQECDYVKNCSFRNEKTGCNLCILKDECREESRKIFARIDILEEKIAGMLRKLESLFFELFVKQQKESKES